MGRKSTIKLNPAIRKAVDDALQRGCTIDAIKDMLDAMGAEIGRSSVGRYAKEYGELVERQRDIRSVADSFAAEFGSSDDNQTQLMIQMMTTLITQQIMPMVTGDTKVPDAMGLQFLARAMKDATSAAKIEDDRRRTIRKEMQLEAVKVAEDAARHMGASKDMSDFIKAKIMGIKL